MFKVIRKKSLQLKYDVEVKDLLEVSGLGGFLRGGLIATLVYW